MSTSFIRVLIYARVSGYRRPVDTYKVATVKERFGFKRLWIFERKLRSILKILKIRIEIVLGHFWLAHSVPIHISRYSLVRTLSNRILRIIRIFMVERRLRLSRKIRKIRIKSLLVTEYLEIWVGTECASQKLPRTISIRFFRISRIERNMRSIKFFFLNSNRKCSRAFLTCAFGSRIHITRYSVARRLFIRI
jgi:hypothetical protein